jgi:DNA polymerase-3 subunit delta
MPPSDRDTPGLKSFASSDRFLAEIRSPSLRPGYVLAGDEIFLQDRCRQAVLNALAPPDLRDFCLHDLDLSEISIFEALDRAQTPSLMAPFQVIFLRNLKTLYTRGSKKEEFAAIDAYFRSPNPQALLLFIADHLHLPTDRRRMELQDKERFDRIRETLGDWCGVVELAQVEEGDAARWVIAHAEQQSVHFDPEAARELVDALGANMMLIASEVEKLLLYVTAPLSPHSVIPTGGEAAVEGPASQPGTPIATLSHPSTGVLATEAPQTLPSQPPSSGAKKPASPPTHEVRVTLGDVETMVLAAKQRSLYDLTDAITAHDRPHAIALLHGLLNASDGGEDAAIGHLYMLARTFRQMLIILEKNVRDSRAIWQVLWQGFRMPPFAAEDLIRQARRYKSRRDLTRALRLIARADLDLRSSPISKRLVLERLILDLATDPATRPAFDSFPPFAFEL